MDQFVDVNLSDIYRRIECLQRRICELYQSPVIQEVYMSRFHVAEEKVVPLSNCEQTPESVVHVEETCKKLRLACYSIVQVPSDYYTWGLLKRACRLLAPSAHHLCKSVLFMNTKYAPFKEFSDPYDCRNSKFYLVIFQYVTKVSEKKLHSFIRDTLGGQKISKQKFNLRVASEEDCQRLTGFGNGAVAGIGLSQSRVPIILASPILKLNPPIIWMGGGHVDWKLMVSAPEYVFKVGCQVGDVTVPSEF